MRVKSVARLMAASAVMFSGLAFSAGRAEAALNVNIKVYLQTNGAPSGAGPFLVTVSGADFPLSTASADSEQVITGGGTAPGSFSLVPKVNSDGFAIGPSGALPFFLNSVYCIDYSLGPTHLTPPISYSSATNIDCFVIYDKATSMTLTKQMVGGPSEWEFVFGLDNTSDISGDGDKFNDVDDSYRYPNQGSTSVSWTEVLKPGVQYSVSEYGERDGNLPTWVDVDCGDGDGTFTPAAGENLSCTATNTYPIGLEIEKRSNGSNGEFHFTLTNDNTGPVDLAVTTTGAETDGIGNAFNVFDLTYEGTYTIAEVDQAGWNEGTIECTVTHDDNSTTVTSDGTFSVVNTDSVTCEVLNTRPLNVSMTKTVTGDTDPAPGGTTQYTMVVTNNSAQYWAVQVGLLDELPAHLVPTSTPTAGCLITGQTLACKLPPLAPGASASVVVNVQVAADAAVPVSLANTASLYDLSFEVDALLPIVSASLSETGANTTLMLQLALATIGLGALILTFSRRRALR